MKLGVDTGPGSAAPADLLPSAAGWTHHRGYPRFCPICRRCRSPAPPRRGRFASSCLHKGNRRSRKKHERMSLGRWGCGAGVAGRVRRLEIRTAVAGALVLAGARSSLATRLHVAQQRRGATLSLTGTTCGRTVHCGTVGFLPLTGTTWMCVRPHRE